MRRYTIPRTHEDIERILSELLIPTTGGILYRLKDAITQYKKLLNTTFTSAGFKKHEKKLKNNLKYFNNWNFKVLKLRRDKQNEKDFRNF